MSGLRGDDIEEPPFAPDVAVEIRSPSDRERNIQTKVQLYLEHGATLVLDVDPFKREIIAHDASGKHTFNASMHFEHAALPGLRLDVGDLFARADPKCDPS